MKPQTKIKAPGLILFFSLLLIAFSLPTQKVSAQPDAQVSFQVFYDNLAPYGTWFNDPQYGYVWAPNVSRSFRPYYTDGYWVNTEYGNMWMSEYPWGWATFHYGRWAYSDYYGWIWVPGDEWGPSWVNWRQGDGYYGWAPMGPGISINVSFGSGYYLPNDYWTFIPYGYLYAHSFHRYYTPRRTRTIIRNTTIINNTYVNNRHAYVTGPRRRDYERRTGHTVSTYQVGTRNDAGHGRLSGRTVSVYRPAVSRKNSRAHEVRPSNVKQVSHSVISRQKTRTTTAPERLNRTSVDAKKPIERSQGQVRAERNNTHVNSRPIQKRSESSRVQAPSRQRSIVKPAKKVQPQQRVAPRQVRASSVPVSKKPTRTVRRTVERPSQERSRKNVERSSTPRREVQRSSGSESSKSARFSRH